MAYMNQDRKATIAAAVKPILAKYGVKGTLSTDRYSITLTLRDGYVDFVADMNDTRYDVLNGDRVVDKARLRTEGFEVNPYWYQEAYKPGSEAVQFLDEVIPAMKAADYFDHSDISTDYFDCSYYFHIKVGRWNKPYVCTAVAAGV
jgi:hypothetical protein